MAGRVNTPQKKDKTERISLLISGIVQGVGFRQATYWEARQLGLGGWVRNLPDGRVEVLAEGSPTKISALMKWCELGPAGAEVKQVELVSRVSVEKSDAVPGFEIRR